MPDLVSNRGASTPRRSPFRTLAKAAAIVLALCVVGTCIALAFLAYQATRRPTGRPDYVALGSSYAAGSGLGERVGGAPFGCMRGNGSYPHLLARRLGLSLVDMSCSGATASQVLNGGQYFQGPQVAAVTAQTKLVTLTVGGNDLHYVGDLLGLAKRKDGGVVGWIAPRLLLASHTDPKRDANALGENIRAIVRTVRRKAPSARIVIATYPAILPEQGACPLLRLTMDEAARMRALATTLAQTTRDAAHDAGATLVDMVTLGRDHDACSLSPWVNGAYARSGDGGAFHPTRLGAASFATSIASTLVQTRRGR
ncbi:MULTISPECIES: SGNH/GDSL hydrolase family protein [unclassified Sphingomonas]|uniref:SGNH/GDSL hydrolase family protein n=1 Tax=unclassified Sphingomonas TaxID=196159 RepID=UPI001783D389|nr:MULTISPECIES: SGNH/GDSL hydrolase family protein [unclassified Sphingomonas]MBD8737182.1 SGNH/GDSL hydrolase family protein [Sphingomonas sp. CFBP 13706]